jgi:hypothetical integral membrane protein (TIGR02206 family)
MPGAGFETFGPAHLAILASIPALAYALGRVCRRSAAAARTVRLSFGVLLLINELVFYGYRYWVEGARFPNGLPLHLCDLTVWTTIAALFTLRQWCFEFSYFAGVAGAALAMITPDLQAGWPSYVGVYYFLVHGSIVAAILALIWGGVARPLPGSVWRSFGIVNLFGAMAGGFNHVFGTNYMYLCRKPASATPLDWFGDWPMYLLVGEAVALALFWLMWLPFAKKGRIDAGAATPLR